MEYLRMIRRLASVFGVMMVLSMPAVAAAAERIGYGHLMTNDYIGDGLDRWRSGSMSTSLVWGPEWRGTLPSRPGELIELRLLAETIAPNNLVAPQPGSRPFAGHLAIGLHTHFQLGATEMTLGGDLSVIGPQTGLDDFQDTLHSLFGMDGPSALTRAGQIGNQIKAGVVLEMGREVALGESVRFRPFVEARSGAETLVRGGFDLSFGRFGLGEMMVRDAVTGQRYRVAGNAGTGTSLVLGGDLAHVWQSVFLPENRGLNLTDSRARLRAGVHWQGEKNSIFYGVTWMGKEFTGQSEGQLVGSLRLKLDF